MGSLNWNVPVPVMGLVAIVILSQAGCGYEAPRSADRTANKSIHSLDTLQRHIAHTHTVIVENLNGDGIPDTAWVECGENAIAENMWPFTRIRFSANVPDLVDSQSTGGVIVSIEDLDENGTDELVFLPDWPTSCWIGIRVYGLRNGGWDVFAGGSYYRCNDGAYEPDSLADRVRKIVKGEFELIEDSWDSDIQTRVPKRFTIH